MQIKLKTGLYLNLILGKLLTSEAINLLGSTKIKITKNEYDENVPNLGITELVLVTILWTMITNMIKEDSCIHLLQINHLVNSWRFGPINITLLITVNSLIPYIGLRFSDQEFKLLWEEDKVKITLVIN